MRKFLLILWVSVLLTGRCPVQALQCLVSILRSLVEWYTVSTPVVAANDSTSAFDQSMRSDWGTLTSVAGQDPSSEATEGEAAPAADSELPVPGE